MIQHKYDRHCSIRAIGRPNQTPSIAYYAVNKHIDLHACNHGYTSVREKRVQSCSGDKELPSHVFVSDPL